MSRFEDLVEQLSAVAPRDFTKERAALAAHLAKLGQPAEAARVKLLRAPAVPVWAANRLVREHPELAQRLVSAAERVRAAQLGRDTTIQLASAMGGYRAAVDALLQRLDALLGATGAKASPPVRLRIRNTLMAAAADPKFRSALLHGDLTQELSAPGFDLFQGAAAAERPEGGARRAAAAERPWGRPRRAEGTERRKARPEAPPRPPARERQAAARDERARRQIEARAAAEREREARAERLRPLREAAATAAEELAQARDAARRAAAAVAAAARRKREVDQTLRNALGRRSKG